MKNLEVRLKLVQNELMNFWRVQRVLKPFPVALRLSAFKAVNNSRHRAIIETNKKKKNVCLK